MESLPRLRPGVKVRQVSTHTHDRALLPGYGKFKQIGHWDFETIPPNGAWEFPLLPGPGMVTAVWMTFAYTFLEMLLRQRVPGHRFY